LDEVDVREFSHSSISPDRRVAAKLSGAAALCSTSDGPNKWGSSQQG
jgi:hypothetical protein